MKRALFLVLAAALVAPVLAQQPTAAELFNRGLLLEKAEGKVRDAISLYERVVREFPKDQEVTPQALYQLALAYQATNDGRAMATFARLADEFPSNRFAAEARQRVGASPSSPFRVKDISESLKNAVSSAFSDDGRLVAFSQFSDGGLRVHVRDLSSGKDLAVIDAKSGPPTMQFSPSGKRLAAVWGGRGSAQAPADAHLRLVDATGAGRHIDLPLSPVMTVTPPNIGQMPWSPDGNSIAYLAPAPSPTLAEVHLWSANAPDRALGIQIGAPTSFKWSPDGRRLAFRFQRPDQHVDEIRVVTLSTGEARTIAGAGFSLGRWTADDRLVVRHANESAPATTDMFLVPATGGAPTKICTERTGETCFVSASGKYVFRRSADEKRYFVRDTATGPERPLTRASGEEQALGISADDRVAAFLSNRDGHWAAYVATLDVIPITNPVRVADMDAAMANSSALIVQVAGGLILRSLEQEQNVARLDVDPRTGRAAPAAVLERLTQDTPLSDGPAVSPDGKLIAYRYRSGLKSGIAVMDASGANERRLLEFPQRQNIPLFWRSNEELLFAGTGGGPRTVSSISVRTGVVTPVRTVSPGGMEYVRGRDEVLSATDNQNDPNPPVFRAISLATGAERIIRPGTKVGDYIDLWFVSPDGKQIAYKVDRDPLSELRVMNLDGSGDRALIPMSKDEPAPVAWSGDSRFLLFDPTYDGEAAKVLNVETGESWPLLKDWPSWGSEGAWAPDNSFIVVTTSESRRVWQLFSGITYDTVAKLMKK